VNKVNTQTLANAAESAIVAMVDVLVWVVVIELAYVTEITAKGDSAVCTIGSERLHHQALLTHDFLDGVSVDFVF
jgi:hypothetical protein